MMGMIEQARTTNVTEEVNPNEVSGKNFNKLGDGNVLSNQETGENNNVLVDENLSKIDAKKQSDDILKDKETKNQLDQLKELGKKYKNGELKDIQQKQYEDLMSTIRGELDRDVPTVVEMNNEIDVNYYNEHPEEAAKKADEIVKDYNNMNDVELVSSVVSRSDYLGIGSKQKLYSVIQNYDKDIKAILDVNQKEYNSEK